MNLSGAQCVEFIVQQIALTFSVTRDVALRDTMGLIGTYGAQNASGSPAEFLGYALSIVSSQPCHKSFVDTVVTNADIFKHPSFNRSEAKWNASLDRLAEEHRLLTGNGVFRCRRCGSGAVTVTTVQVRSADEGMTELRTCRECGKVTRINA
jgi:DNA-directed RNA polymerase subunit M/transcription elongation factor TFIIS